MALADLARQGVACVDGAWRSDAEISLTDLGIDRADKYAGA